VYFEYFVVESPIRRDEFHESQTINHGWRNNSKTPSTGKIAKKMKLRAPPHPPPLCVSSLLWCFST
jgi:hypothetical protein